jgi:hypothetical protein
VRKGESTSGSVSPSTLSSRQETIAAETNHSRKRGMVLPFEPHSITFDEVTYSVVMPQVKSFTLSANHNQIYMTYE